MTEKTTPNLTLKQLLFLAYMELYTERRRCTLLGVPYDGTKVNGQDLVDVLHDHLTEIKKCRTL